MLYEGKKKVSSAETLKRDSYTLMAKLTGFNLVDPTVFFGILVSGAIPAVFFTMLILGVDKNAQRMIAEIHRQLKDLILAGLVAIISTLAIASSAGSSWAKLSPLLVGLFIQMPAAYG